MGSRNKSAAMVSAAVLVALTGCRGGARSHAVASGAPAEGGGATTAASGAPAAGPTAGQLKKALISPPAGAAHVISAAGGLPGVLPRLSGGVTPSAAPGIRGCPRPGALGLGGSHPAAFLGYTRGGGSYTILLVGVRDPAARKLVRTPLPARCRSLRLTAGGTSVTARVSVDEPLHIADGGRVIRTDETSGGVRLRSWEAVFAAPAYVAMVDVAGIDVTRADAERTAREVRRKADATLR